MTHDSLRIGFVSTRFAGTDGVSLETAKWASILTALGHICVYFAGELDRPPDRSYVVEEAHFQHHDIQILNDDLFNDQIRQAKTTEHIHQLSRHIKQHLYRFQTRFELDILIVENALSIPMNIPLALALTEFIAETRIPTIAHHHDFYWERKRFSVNAAQDYLHASFPPTLPSIQHVVINSFAARQLALRTGANSTLIPNVMDFEHEPPPPDGYADDLRVELGISEDQTFILQPTRIVPRKRIEHAIELTRRLNDHSILVISHQSGDEGSTYEKYLRNYAGILSTNVIFGSDIIDHHRGSRPDGRKCYSLGDAYQKADLITYPSTVEGFGNAFLETIYYRRPIVMSNYEIFKTDIQPKGFRVIGFDDFIGDDTVELAQNVINDPSLAEEITEHNYQLGKRFFSFTVLEQLLVSLINRSRNFA